MYRRRSFTDIEALEELGSAVRDARQRAGLSQRHLEALSGVNQSAISRMERGRVPGMRLDKLARIAMVLGELLLVPADPADRGDAWTRLMDRHRQAGMVDTPRGDTPQVDPTASLEVEAEERPNGFADR
jgi:transcriptional regulator with XRE-family HTH domain